MSWKDRFVDFEPRPDVEYSQALGVLPSERRPGKALALGIGGAMLGLLSFWIIRGYIALAVIWLFWVGSGSPGTLASFSTGSSANELAKMTANLVSLAFLIPMTMALVLFLHRFDPRWLSSVQPGFRWRYAAIATGAGFVVLGGIWAISRIGQAWVWSPETQWVGYLVVILLLAPLQAAGEEYFFRGYLIQALHSAAPSFNALAAGDNLAGKLAMGYQRWFGVVASAFIFALMHGGQNLPLFLHRFAFGLIAGWLVIKTGGLEAGIAAHVVNNLLAFGYAAISGTMAETRAVSVATWPELVWNLVGFAGFAAVAVFIGKRMKLATRTPRSGLVASPAL